eukprot:1159692-Pelagomonas_calceolata.AAC.6
MTARAGFCLQSWGAEMCDLRPGMKAMPEALLCTGKACCQCTRWTGMSRSAGSSAQTRGLRF